MSAPNIVTWTIDPGAYLAAITQQRVDAIEADIVSLADSLTDEITDYMKAEARWQDDSGDARAGLWSDVEHMARQAVYIVISHDVTLDYTWFLEYAHQGRFEILSTTVDHVWPRFLRGVMEIAKKHSY